MKITLQLTIDAATEEDLARAHAFLAHYAGTVTVDQDDTWTPERAERYYLALSPRSQYILEEALGRGGYVAATKLRGEDGTDSLKGWSNGLKRALNRGINEGWWPATMLAPVQGRGPGFGKVVGYKVPEELYDTFAAAVLPLPTRRHATLSQEITNRGPEVPWDVQLAAEVLGICGLDTTPNGAEIILRHLADTGLIIKTDPDRAVYRLATDQVEEG
ncbi:hypothetical protein ACIRYZ_36650 [Kitasatospora sp. NPDC101155]|uniref:hypothetical protein n=1 Tax=Kitasatospora sp. NPDC101155 TaxID=3364097 RepID=UPI0038097479